MEVVVLVVVFTPTSASCGSNYIRWKVKVWLVSIFLAIFHIFVGSKLKANKLQCNSVTSALFFIATTCV